MCVFDGSSPLARGTPAEAPAPGTRDRFIPARAGNTCGCRPPMSCGPVHPRSRGEHEILFAMAGTLVGSSPLARGTRRRDGRGAPGLRFIPARAGNTRLRPRRTSRAPVHPRSRGEHSPTRPILRSVPGSSPLARGTRDAGARRRHALRFIPARAGNTPHGVRPVPRGPVHPRSRGEHLPPHCVTATPAGSSPLARGTLDHRLIGPTRYRFIPARAGNTEAPCAAPIRAPVHPRSRGEHARSVSGKSCRRGSSPLARGTRPQPGREIPGLRFIPARAGNTWHAIGASSRPTVHPRSRGEHHAPGPSFQARPGSSPLARGTRAICEREILPARFIPARAGNTSAR